LLLLAVVVVALMAAAVRVGIYLVVNQYQQDRQKALLLGRVGQLIQLTAIQALTGNHQHTPLYLR
jgi:hypothetical protein